MDFLKRNAMQFNNKINKKLLPMKGHYLFLYCGLSPIAPFVPVIAKGLGFSAFLVGTIFTVVPLLSVLIKPSMGGIADKFQCQKPMFLTFIVIQSVFFVCTLWLPSLPLVSTKINCDNSSRLQICSKRLKPDDTYLIYDKNGNNVTFHCMISCLEKAIELGIKIEKNNEFKIILETNKSEIIDGCLFIKISQVEIDGTRLVPNCTSTSGNCKIFCENQFLNDIILKPSIPDSEVVNYYQFWLFFLFIAIAKISSSILASTGDAICFNVLGDKPHDFGLQRLWGAVGWGSMSLLSGFIIDKLSEGSERKDYTTAYYFLIVFSILDFLVSLRLNYVIKVAPKSIIKETYKVIKNRHILIFLIWCTICGFYAAMVWSYLFWFIEEVAQTNGYDMAYIKTLEGLTLTFHCYLGEIPFFFISGWLIKKIGHIHSMTLVLSAYALRFIYYSYLKNPWWTLPIETLNGITFGTFYATMTTYAISFAPPGTVTTAQTLVGAFFDGLGVSAGSFVGGYMIHRLNSIRTFWILGLSATSFTLLHIVIQLIIGKPKFLGKLNGSEPENEEQTVLNG